jgi:predicted negative regulator of RcsB-dependent stress response
MLNQKTSRWLGSLILLMMLFRFGYKYYHSQQRPKSEEQLTSIKARVQALSDSIEASQDLQQAQGATVVVADSAVLATDTVATAK